MRQPEIESGEICSFQPARLVGWSGSPQRGERRHFQLWSVPYSIHTGFPFELITKTCKVLMNYRGHIDQWTVRMNGYDSPEMKPPKTNQNREKEKEAAKKAREALMTHFTNSYIFIKIVGFDKYGRLLVEAYNGKVHINKWMIQTGHGYSYDGGKKKNYNEE